MILYKGKLIKDLSNDELWAAIQSVAHMDNFRFDKLADRRIKKENHRLNKIFNANPLTENQVFTNLVDALNAEFLNRNKEL